MLQTVSTISRGTIFNKQASIAVIDATHLVNTVRRRHALSPEATRVLGKTYTAAAYLCSWLKDEKSALTVTIGANGNYGKVCVSGDGALHMRGFIENPEASGALKASVVSVVRDDGNGLPFAGSVGLDTDDIAHIFSKYFAESEQRPTAIMLEALCNAKNKDLVAGGIFIQPLPGAEEDVFERAQECLQGLHEYLLAGDFGAILTYVHAKNVQNREISFRCTCSKSKAERLIKTIGRREAETLLREQGIITIHCDYCNTDYKINGTRLQEIYEGNRKG